MTSEDADICDEEYARKYGIDGLIDFSIKQDTGVSGSVDADFTDPFAPKIHDLMRLHRLCLGRKVTTVLEFGCGYSSLVFAHALQINSLKHGGFVRENLRRHDCFEVHSVDDMEDYIKLAAERTPEELRPFAHFHKSAVNMTQFNDRICTEYDALPNICPDLVYLDGPSQHAATGTVNGITTAHPDRLPMSCDLLKIEHFFLPGTLIVVDGRTANARFLKLNFQRQWAYRHDEINDVHYFELQEAALGKYNRLQLEFCLGNKWLLEQNVS